MKGVAGWQCACRSGLKPHIVDVWAQAALIAMHGGLFCEGALCCCGTVGRYVEAQVECFCSIADRRWGYHVPADTDEEPCHPRGALSLTELSR